MKVLVIGAGALGGYFGGRLAQAGRDVTFLVRPRRREQLRATGGLVVKSPAGDFTLDKASLTTADELRSHFDLILLSCKGFHLDQCMNDFSAAVGPGTAIVPVLNGMRHIEKLSERFGREHVLGGRSNIFATLDAEGRVLHQAPLHVLTFGELDGDVESDRIRKVNAVLSDAGFEAVLSNNILQDMWEKWVFIAAMAGMTSLMRASIGDMVKAGAGGMALAACGEAARIAEQNGHCPSGEGMAFYEKILTDGKSQQSASMLKDIEKGQQIEVEQIIGDLFTRVPADTWDAYPLLNVIYRHLLSYEVRRERGGLPRC